MARWMAWLGAIGTIAGLACGGDTAGPEAGITVSLSVQPPFAEPGDTVRVTVTAVPTAGVAVAVMRVAASGLISKSDSVRVSGSGSQSLSQAYVLPFQPGQGSVSFVATAEGGGVTGTARTTLQVSDAVPPKVSSVNATPSVQPDEWITVDYTATDNVGLAWTVVHLTGAFTATDSVAHAFAKSVTRSVQFRVPASTPLGSKVNVRVIAADPTPQFDSASPPPVLVTDLAPPLVGGSATGPETTPTLVAGDTLHVAVNATDNFRVAWLGYRLGPPASMRDSVAASTASASHPFSAIAQSNWLGSSAVTLFARDSLGNLAETSLPAATVVKGIRRPTHVFPLDASVYDMAYGVSRNALYLSQPDPDRVLVFSVGTLAFAPPIQLFSRPQGLDLTVGGDSLVVALRTSPYLAIVNLVSGHTDTVRLNMTSLLNPGPANVRVMGNSKAMVTISFSGSGFGGQVIEYDLVSGTQRARSDAGVGGPVTEVVPLARAGDRSDLLLIIDNNCCPEDGNVYVTATDTVAVKHATVSRYNPKISANQTGSLFLIGESLFDSNLNLLRTFTSSYSLGGSNTIAPDGLSVYLGKDYGYLKLRASDGVLVEDVRVGLSFERLFALPGGLWLAGIAGDPTTGAPRLVLIDLR